MAARLVSSCRLQIPRMRLLALPVTQTRVQSSSADAEAPAVRPVVKENESGLKNLIMEKLGVTGPWTLGLGLATLLVSKEIYVYNEETIVALTMFGVFAYGIRNYGPAVGKYLDERNQKILKIFEDSKKAQMSSIEEQLDDLETYKHLLTYNKDFFEILRENDAIERETTHRQQLLDVQTAVKRRFDYQLQLQLLKRQFEQRQLVGWIKEQVLQSVRSKPDETLPQCMATLKRLSAAH